MDMRSKWCEIFVAEPIEEVIEIFRKNGLGVEYDENLKPSGLAMGYLEGDSGVVMSCRIWREKIRREANSCIEIRGASGRFEKILNIITSSLDIIYNGHCDNQEEVKMCKEK